MRWKTPQLQVQFLDVHPEVRRLVLSLDAWSQAEKLPELVVTGVLRTIQEQEELYWKLICTQQRVGEAKARELARAKPSWHLWRCAVDIRNTHYTPEQLERVMAYLRPCCPPGAWELLAHDIGAGEHLHVARRDIAWRQKWLGASA